MFGGVETQEIQKLIEELEDRKTTSLDDSFNQGIDFAIRKVESLIYEESYFIRKYGK